MAQIFLGRKEPIPLFLRGALGPCSCASVQVGGAVVLTWIMQRAGMMLNSASGQRRLDPSRNTSVESRDFFGIIPPGFIGTIL